MRFLLKNGTVVNVFTGELEKANVLIENEKILGVGEYSNEEADVVRDVSGSYICPGFIDGHIHIESSMMTPAEFAKAAVPHGTTTLIADPHEIANVCGTKGIQYMLEASEGLPLTVYIMLPSCVPATPFEEAGAFLLAEDLELFYQHPRVLGLGEMMNYPGVLAGNEEVLKKIESARTKGKTVNGHAPLLSGKELDKYISCGIRDDHECSLEQEAKERIRKGQRVMIRQGTAAKNLAALLPLFDAPWASRCMLVTDDKHPADLLENGYLDDTIRRAARAGKNPITAIQMATIQAAEGFGIQNLGAVAPGYIADILVLDSLETCSVKEVYKNGECVAENGTLIKEHTIRISKETAEAMRSSFHIKPLTKADFHIDCDAKKTCRVIKTIKNELLTEEWITELDFKKENGVDLNRDIIKLAVCERHKQTGHIGLGFLSGIGMKSGAIASSVSHDSHNLIVVGTNEADMAEAANYAIKMGGGLVVVEKGKALASLPLPVAGLMSESSAEEVAGQNEALRKAVHALGVPGEIEPFMTTAFVSLPVIPHIKMSTCGLVDVDKQIRVDLFLE